MSAAQFQAGNLIVFADCNNHQSGGKVSEMSSLYPLTDKWQAFHWHVQRVDGHDIDALHLALHAAKLQSDRPSLIACDTIKGKGIPYMEHNNAWHKRTPNEAELALARSALEYTP